MGIRFTQVVKIGYRIRINEDDLLKIMDLDKESDASLYQILVNMDHVLEADYDGHFGPWIYVTIDPTILDSLKPINRAIEKYLELPAP
jgi:hypothetical protein